jgi:hypothetical protein
MILLMLFTGVLSSRADAAPLFAPSVTLCDAMKELPHDPFKAFADSIGLELRKSLRERLDYEKPARFQVRNGPDEDGTYGIDAGAKLRVFPWSQARPRLPLEAELHFTAEVHRNSASGAKEQNELILGPSVYAQIGSNAGGVKFNVPVNYKSNRVKHTESLIVGVDALAMWSEAGVNVVQNLLPVPDGQLNSELQYALYPRIGVEFEDTLDAPTSADEGGEGRAYASLDVTLLPFAVSVDNRWELSAGYKHWEHFSQSGAFDRGDDDEDLFVASTRYYIDAYKRIAIGVEYSDGANPSTDLPNSEFWQLALEFRF